MEAANGYAREPVSFKSMPVRTANTRNRYLRISCIKSRWDAYHRRMPIKYQYELSAILCADTAAWWPYIYIKWWKIADGLLLDSGISTPVIDWRAALVFLSWSHRSLVRRASSRAQIGWVLQPAVLQSTRSLYNSSRESKASAHCPSVTLEHWVIVLFN